MMSSIVRLGTSNEFQINIGLRQSNALLFILFLVVGLISTTDALRKIVQTIM